MGDRALVIFTDKKRESVSPTVYLHWGGAGVTELIDKLGELMSDRRNDVDYAAARFVGICHDNMGGNLSLGIWNTSEDIQNEIKMLLDEDPEVRETATKTLKEHSHGDAGVVIVDTSDFTWSAFGGYLEDAKSKEDAA